MPWSTRIPPLLQPYVRLPHDESILLLTSTLGASANWLTIRFICDALSSSSQDGGEEVHHNVVLVSWMREYDFWRQETRKGGGTDLEKVKKDGRFAFVDGLSGLFSQSRGALGGEGRDQRMPARTTAMASSLAGTDTATARAPQLIPMRGPPERRVLAQGPSAIATQTTDSATTSSTTAHTASTNQNTTSHFTLQSADIADLMTTVSDAVSALTTSSTPSNQPRKTLLILDNPDVLLATNPNLTTESLTSHLLTLHTLPTLSHILVHIQADTPLLSLSSPPQPLEISQHNLLVKIAHMTRRILGVRVLDTGVARDVSGVIRITEMMDDWMGLGLSDGNDYSSGREEDGGRGKEFLYQVKGDGTVRVFERGAGGES